MLRNAAVIMGLLIMAVVLPTPAFAQATDADLQTVIQRGELATVASLCSLRDEAWAEDLRRAAIQDATRATSPEDEALRAAPGSDAVQGALGYADTEALEDFAARPPEQSCKRLVRQGDLAAADRRVAAYRRDLARARFSGS